VTRVACSLLVVGACVTALGARAPQGVPAIAPEYRQVASVPAIVNGNTLGRFQFDPVGRRLYAGSTDGLFWLNVDATAPRWQGPVFKSPVTLLRIAPELRRLFFATREDVGYINLDALDAPRMLAHVRAGGLVYEPERRELYISFRAPQIVVFNAETGERSDSIKVPGWYGQLLEAIPGRVFLTLPDKPGLYVINAASHRIGAWPVDGKISTPAAMEVDPSGRHIFLSYHQNIVAIDTATAKVVGRITTLGTAAIAFDPGTRLLVAFGVTQPSPIRLTTHRVEASGFIDAGSLANPAMETGVRLEPTSGGFLQRTDKNWLIWSAGPPRQ
jgi:hypothetical protein